MDNNLHPTHSVAQAIVDTLREPLLVLDEHLRVVTASSSFYLTFKAAREETEGRMLYALGDGQWNIPKLHELLKHIVSDGSVLNDFEVEHDFPGIGPRILFLNARRIFYEQSGQTNILLALEDITDRRAIEQERDNLSGKKDLLLAEMQHRVANSLQLIASILLMKAKSVTSEEMRGHLQDAHKRVLAVAAVQKHLQPTIGAEIIELGPYLKQLCASLASSMIGPDCPITVHVAAGEGGVTSSEAVSVGLIVTELVINSLKHAFPVVKPDCVITVAYWATAGAWELTVTDNGIGKITDDSLKLKVGLGTTIVKALATQLRARVRTNTTSSGTTVSISHMA